MADENKTPEDLKTEIERLERKVLVLRSAIMIAKGNIEGHVICHGGDDPPGVYRCFDCDEFMNDAVWPEHGNRNCPTREVLAIITAALNME